MELKRDFYLGSTCTVGTKMKKRSGTRYITNMVECGVIKICTKCKIYFFDFSANEVSDRLQEYIYTRFDTVHTLPPQFILPSVYVEIRTLHL